MQYLLTISGLLLFFLFSSCEDANQRSPEQTAREFLTHFKDKDYEGAKTYASRETDATVMSIGRLMELNQNKDRDYLDNLLTQNVDPNSELSYTCEDDGNEATCQCCKKATEECMTLHLIRENGQWVVHQPKESTVE